MNKNSQTIEEFVAKRNSEKFIFTAGPASLLPENITGLRACFGRGDMDYLAIETKVIGALKKMSGHENVTRMQGSASLALEVMALNFLYGRVLVVQSGYYSQRLVSLASSARRWLGQIIEIQTIQWDQINQVQGKFDWVVACYTETSRGLKIPILSLREIAERHSAKLMIDATASIGLESRHEVADVIAYSSCKGLFGLTGAAFIANHEPPTVEVDSFNLSMSSHIEKMMTGPYHAIASLANVLSNHEDIREAVVENKKIFAKKMKQYLTTSEENQPLLCTHVSCKIAPMDARAIMYVPRTNYGGSVVCHIGEVHLGRSARGKIFDVLEIEK